MDTSVLKREDVEKSLTWDLTALYQNEKDFENDYDRIDEKSKLLEESFKGKLSDPETIVSCLDSLREVLELLGKAGTYAFLEVSVDQSNSSNQARQGRFNNLQSKVAARLSFIRGEILNQNKEIIESAIELSSSNKNYLNEIMRFKPYVLHEEAEKVLAGLSSVLESPFAIYSKAKLADLDFKPFKVGKKEYPLSFVLFENHYEYETDKDIRREAFRAFSEQLRAYQHTMGGTFGTQVLKEKTLSDLRGFKSVIDSLLFPQEVDRSLYDRQIDIIMEKLAPHMRKYAKFLGEIHNIEKLEFADLKLTVDPDFEPSISVEESKNYLFKALSIFGEDYLDMVKRSFDERWIDFVQNKGKTTGAFCASPYLSHPFVLISWSERMREVFVLAHELGHAGHFYLSHKNQNIFDSRPSLYFIEAPSTMNEMIMADYLMKKEDDLRFKRWVLSSMISRTYYHNFVTHLLEAHFQREVYKIIDSGGSVQASDFNRLKRESLEAFWGDTVNITEGAELTWMRQLHYYKGLYPYTYSAGLTVATAVMKRIKEEGRPAVNDWISVLKAGGTLNPVELAKLAGVDITTEKPLLDTIEYIGNIIDEIISLTKEIEKTKNI